MFERQERTAILLLIGVAIIVILAHRVLAAAGNEPFARHFDNKTPDGELAKLEGGIDQIIVTKDGGHVISLSETPLSSSRQMWREGYRSGKGMPRYYIWDCPDISGKEGTCCALTE